MRLWRWWIVNVQWHISPTEKVIQTGTVHNFICRHSKTFHLLAFLLHDYPRIKVVLKLQILLVKWLGTHAHSILTALTFWFVGLPNTRAGFDRVVQKVYGAHGTFPPFFTSPRVCPSPVGKFAPFCTSLHHPNDCCHDICFGVYLGRKWAHEALDRVFAFVHDTCSFVSSCVLGAGFITASWTDTLAYIPMISPLKLAWKWQSNSAGYRLSSKRRSTLTFAIIWLPFPNLYCRQFLLEQMMTASWRPISDSSFRLWSLKRR